MLNDNRMKTTRTSFNIPRVSSIVPAKRFHQQHVENLKRFTWRAFAKTTSIRGLLYIFGRRNLNKQTRFFWSIIFAILFLWCLTICVKSIQIYNRHNLKVTMTNRYINYTKDQLRSFPIVLFCNERTFLKREVAKTKIRQFIVALLNTKTIGEAIDVAKRAEAHYDDIRELEENVTYRSEETVYTLEDDYSYATLSGWQLNIEQSAKQCWILNKNYSCTSLLDHYQCADLTKCFSFNTKMLQTNFHSANNVQLMPAYEPIFDNIKVFGFGPKFGGFKILLNVNQPETYNYAKLWNGVGFRVQVTTLENSCYDADNLATLLTPGYSYSIGITQVIIKRKTQHLGLCNDDRKILIFKHSDVFYQNADCYNFCLYKLYWINCKCYPPNINHDDIIDLAQLLGLNLTNDIAKPCSETFNAIQCALGTIKRLESAHLPDLCPACKVHCYEEKYQLQISALKFSQAKLYEYRSLMNESDIEQSSSNIVYIRKNFLLANFYYLNNDYVDVVEEQAMKIDALFTSYIGNAICLHLGMSFISPFEVVFQMLVYIYVKLVGKFVEKQKSYQTRVIPLKFKLQPKNVKLSQSIKGKRKTNRSHSINRTPDRFHEVIQKLFQSFTKSIAYLKKQFFPTPMTTFSGQKSFKRLTNRSNQWRRRSRIK